jgi:hypothetical protein
MGLRAIVPEKPYALKLYEQIQELGLPLWSGGLLDQPYIWLQEYKICSEITAVFKALQAAQEKNNG